MKDAGNPTRWQMAGMALAATVIAAGLVLATPGPRLDADGEPGGVVRTVEETPDRRRQLARLVRQAAAANDGDAHEPSTDGDGGDHPDEEPDTSEPTGAESTATQPAPSEDDAPVEPEPPLEDDPVLEEDPPTRDGDGDEEGDED